MLDSTLQRTHVQFDHCFHVEAESTNKCVLSDMSYILKHFNFVGTKDGPPDHDWSLYLRSITRDCMGRLNSVELKYHTDLIRFNDNSNFCHHNVPPWSSPGS